MVEKHVQRWTESENYPDISMLSCGTLGDFFTENFQIAMGTS